MQFPIPVSILTGFLGSGKTTLLNRLLREPDLADTAVIVNEFGEISIDHALVETASDGVIELAGGCLCCTVRGELVDTLNDLVERLRDGRLASLKRIIIETTGLADPAPVLHSLMAHPILIQTLRLDGVIATIDCVHGLSTMAKYEISRKQIAVADRILLTKSDLASAEQVSAVRAQARALNPNAEIRDATSQASTEALLSCGLYDPATKSIDAQRWLGLAASGDHDHQDDHDHGHHGHDHEHHGHEHHHHHDEDGIRSFVLTHDKPISSAAVEMFIDLMQAGYGDKLLRMKGILELVEDPDHPLVLHGVQTIMHPPTRLRAWPEGPRGTRLVLITQDIPEDYVRSLFSALTNQPRIDTPDEAALRDNPLSIAGLKL